MGSLKAWTWIHVFLERVLEGPILFLSGGGWRGRRRQVVRAHDIGMPPVLTLLGLFLG